MCHPGLLISSGGRLTAPPCGPSRALNPGANRAGTELQLSAPLLHGAKHAGTPNDHCDLGLRRGWVACNPLRCPTHAPPLQGQSALGALLPAALEVRVSVRDGARGGRGALSGPGTESGPVWPIPSLSTPYTCFCAEIGGPVPGAGARRELERLQAFYNRLERRRGQAPSLVRPTSPPPASSRRRRSGAGTTPPLPPPCTRGGPVSYIGANHPHGQPMCVRVGFTLDNEHYRASIRAGPGLLACLVLLPLHDAR